MRLKCRYYIFRIDYGGADALTAIESTSSGDIFASLRTSIQEVFGDAGWGSVASNIAVTAYWPTCARGVIRGPMKSDADVRASIALIKSVRRRAAAVHIEAATGSVRSLRGWLERNALGNNTVGSGGAGGGGGGGAGSGAASAAATTRVNTTATTTTTTTTATAPVLDEAFFLALEAEEEV
jgi:RNase P/RNase MRP subunit POP5